MISLQTQMCNFISASMYISKKLFFTNFERNKDKKHIVFMRSNLPNHSFGSGKYTSN